MTLSLYGGPGEWRSYNIPQTPALPEAKDLKTLEEKFRDKAKALNREQRFEILFADLTERRKLRSRVVNILGQVSGDDEAFGVTLDTIAYAKRNYRPTSREQEFARTVGRIEKCIEDGSLPVEKMKALLGIGVVFDVQSFHYTPEIIQQKRDWLDGLKEGPEDTGTRRFLDKDTLVPTLRGMGVDSVDVESVETPLEEVSARHLGRIYRERLDAQAAEKRLQLADQRRAERFLKPPVDW